MNNNDEVFESYSTFYDLFYTDKNYGAECQYVLNILRSLKPDARELIELGSGTGNYSRFFCDAGYIVTGIEKSESMLYVSNQKNIDNFIPVLANMVSFNLNQKYDIIISLFDVMCYLTQNQELELCFQNVARHLNSGGIFIFDSWFTPGVYSSPPMPNIKCVENDLNHVTRSSNPVVNYERNTVDVHYELMIKNKITDQQYKLNEVHKLRHFSIPEIELFAENAGFKLIGYEEMRTAKPVNKDTWKVCYQLQKK